VSATEQAGCVIWLTGLSAAGKSTIARSLGRRLLGAEILDGDEMRAGLCQGLGFSKEDRDTNVLRIGYVAALLAKHGVYAIVAAISPYRAAREQVRHKSQRFVEIYCKASLDELKRRDPKGLYRKALAGELKGFTGIDDPYEEPLTPELILDTEGSTVSDCARSVVGYLLERRLVSALRVRV
jgi:adenylylsulfate kinase